jgi:hypothetical protein
VAYVRPDTLGRTFRAVGIPWWQVGGWLAGGALSGLVFLALAYRAEKKADKGS